MRGTDGALWPGKCYGSRPRRLLGGSKKLGLDEEEPPGEAVRRKASAVEEQHVQRHRGMKTRGAPGTLGGTGVEPAFRGSGPSLRQLGPLQPVT